MQCTSPNCENDAAFTYEWPWGQTGACCVACKPSIETQATQLGRVLSFVEVPRPERTTDPPPPSNEELAEAQRTVIELHGENSKLEGKVARLERELERAQQANRELARQNQIAGEQAIRLHGELTKLRASEPSTEPSTPAPEPEETSVVEGPSST